MTDNCKMAELLLPQIDKTPDYYENMYPERNLDENARVTRIAPSPTGYLHLGTLFTSLVNRTAVNGNGVFFTRIEDTDKKREVEGGIADIIDGLNYFGIKIDEGYISGTEETGAYGPYKQSLRAEIYQTYVKDLIRRGLAYPCFCTEDELSSTREEQNALKVRTGYHGKWARHRDITFEEAKAQIDAGKSFVIRLRSQGDEEKRITFTDGIKGKIEMPQNDEDFVLLKSDGIPTYHFAHAIDDHLMHTTHVIRGDEWISSVPKHIELFSVLGFKAPKYAHVSPIMKTENGAKRKISKRKDPEAAVRYFIEQGYDADSVIEYLMTVASSDFEDWRRANPLADRKEFTLNLKKMSVSGALFDGDKLLDVSKRVVSGMNSEQVVSKLTDWAKEFDSEFYTLLTRDTEYAKRVFAIDRDCPKPRKDIAKWSDAKDYCSYMFSELYKPDYTMPEKLDKKDCVTILREYIKAYKPTEDKNEWFTQIKDVCPAANFATDTKEYKQNPDAYRGNPGDASTIIRIALTGRQQTPDLCSIMNVLGYDECIARLSSAADYLEEK
ncbi:MAG: glutamate--tRNA ligase [Clostridia bacterium]|nr:glutamate--tRNA ligase [Clostridia bacterium]